MSKTYDLYVGGYNAREFGGITKMLYTPESATVVYTYTDVVNPTYLLVEPQQSRIYCVSECNNFQDLNAGGIYSLSMQDDCLSQLGCVSSIGIGPCHIIRSGSFLYVSNYASGSFTACKIQEDGSLTEANFRQHTGTGANPARQSEPHTHSALATKDGKFILVCDLGTDTISLYPRNETEGFGMPGTEVKTQPGFGPRHMVASPDGSIVYVVGEMGNAVNTYSYDGQTLTLLDSLPTLPDGFQGENTTAAIRMTSDKKYLYISNRGHNSVAAYTVKEDGRLSLIGIYDCGGSWPRDIVVDPEDKYLLVANERSNQVAILPINSDGSLGTARVLQEANRPSCLVFA